MKKEKRNYGYIKYFIPAIILLLFSVIQAQTKSNIEIFNSLVDSSVIKLTDAVVVKSSKIKFEFNQDNIYPTFRNHILADLKDKIEIDEGPESNGVIPVVHYSVEKASVKYGEMFRDGFLGQFMVPREIDFKGAFSVVSGKADVYNFDYSNIDTVSADKLDNIETYSLPFTKGDRPKEPFLSSLFEPVIAIGSAALAVILFFTIRSK